MTERIPFRQSPEDLPLMQSSLGRRRADVPLESLSLPCPDNDDGQVDEISHAADLLGRILAYGTQSKSISTMGKRFWAMCYVLRPDLLDGQTLEGIAAQDGKSYQSIQFYIKEFKHTFAYGTDSEK